MTTSESALQEPASTDAEYLALLALARLMHDHPKPTTPIEALQDIVDLARELTNGHYAALAVTDEKDRTEGFVTSGLTQEELRGLRTPPQAHGPLGSLRGDGRPVRINNLADHPHSFGFPPRHPQMQTLLGVPLWVAQQVRGSLYVTDKHGGESFTNADEAMLVTLARHASHLIESRWY